MPEFLVKCNCRWSCQHHAHAVLNNRSITDPGYCSNMVVEQKYVRVLCPKCSCFQIIVVCQQCWERVHRWMSADVDYTCEQCLTHLPVNKAWTPYEDVRT